MMEGGGDLPSTPLSPPTSGNTTTEQVTAELATPGKQNISSGISSGNRGGRSVKTGAGGVLPASDGRDNVFDKPPLLPCEEVATVAMVPPGMGVDNGEGGGEAQPEVFQQTEKNVSYKYTREELMARYWGINMEQVKRVKALLRLGVDEDDLAIASKLLKLGRPVDDAPLSKEEQLLGYTASQRQRMKALHTLGLTEESFERCRALMLSSLGPTAFGTDVDKTAENAARAAEEEGWTPSTKTRRWYSHSIPDVNGLFRPKSFNYGHLTGPLKELSMEGQAYRVEPVSQKTGFAFPKSTRGNCCQTHRRWERQA
ncbi:unnamed protein product [Ascophyllum nodosum]